MSLVQDLIARNRNGEPIGLPCFCTANEQVLRAVLDHAHKTGLPTVIEATCNQVNQEGGYTGMTPKDFMSWLSSMAQHADVPMDQLILGGDPDPEKLIYIIGTEVPIPGGETEEPDALDVTSVARFQDTIKTHRDAFLARDLHAAWNRIVSVVTQPGVDFGHSSIYPFVPEKAKPLKAAILTEPGLTFEAHSTDYQSTAALAELVKSHFFFLKVGPELTFRFREAVWALADLEEQICAQPTSRIKEVIGERMSDNPGYWQDYYSGTAKEIETFRTYSYSDRIRYYWADPKVAKALTKLLENLSQAKLPETLVSQAFMGLDFGEIPANPASLVNLQIQRCIARYFQAANPLA